MSPNAAMDTTGPELTLVAELTRLEVVQVTLSSVPKEPVGRPDVKFMLKMPEPNVTLTESEVTTAESTSQKAVSFKETVKTKPDTEMDVIGCPVYGTVNFKIKMTS